MPDSPSSQSDREKDTASKATGSRVLPSTGDLAKESPVAFAMAVGIPMALGMSLVVLGPEWMLLGPLGALAGAAIYSNSIEPKDPDGMGPGKIAIRDWKGEIITREKEGEKNPEIFQVLVGYRLVFTEIAGRKVSIAETYWRDTQEGSPVGYRNDEKGKEQFVVSGFTKPTMAPRTAAGYVWSGNPSQISGIALPTGWDSTDLTGLGPGHMIVINAGGTTDYGWLDKHTHKTVDPVRDPLNTEAMVYGPKDPKDPKSILVPILGTGIRPVITNLSEFPDKGTAFAKQMHNFWLATGRPYPYTYEKVP